MQREEARRQLRKEASRQYQGAYKRLAKIVRDNATYCHICKEGSRLGDPWEADHLYPGTPVTSITQLAPAHRSCNASRGNKPLT